MKFTALLASLSLAVLAPGFELTPGKVTEFRVELPDALRELAGEGRKSPTKLAQVAVALTAAFTPDREWPVMVISATSAPRRYASSCRLLGFYAPEALAAGWVLVAADPEPDIGEDDDGNGMRLALLQAAFAALATKWPAVQTSPLAFGGFSGGAKRSGMLAALYATQGRRAVGIFQAGINQETVLFSARGYRRLDDAYRAVPVFLLAGTHDEIAPASAHEDIRDELRRAGFKHVQLETFAGPHAVDPRPLRRALAWFDEVRGKAAEPKDKQAEAR